MSPRSIAPGNANVRVKCDPVAGTVAIEVDVDRQNGIPITLRIELPPWFMRQICAQALAYCDELDPPKRA